MGLILWQARPRFNFRHIKPGEHLYPDLVHLIGRCIEKGGEWSIARVECPQEFVKPHNDAKWYSAHYPIKVKDVRPLESAEKAYLS